METTNYTKIYTGNFIITQLIVDQLEAVGINPIVKDEAESGRLAGFGTFNQGTQELYVHLDEENTALQVVHSVTSEFEANRPSI